MSHSEKNPFSLQDCQALTEAAQSIISYDDMSNIKESLNSMLKAWIVDDSIVWSRQQKESMILHHELVCELLTTIEQFERKIRPKVA